MSDPDVEKNKVMAIVGYIIPIMFFIPLVTDAKNSPFAKFHANQQLVLLICGIGFNVAVMILSSILRFLGFIGIFGLVLFVLAIMGIINAARGEMKPLPVIGGFQILK